MSQPFKYSKMPLYTAHRADAVGVAMSPLREKVAMRQTHDIILSNIQTILRNREINLLHPESREKTGLVVYGDSGAGKSHFFRTKVHTLPEFQRDLMPDAVPFAKVKFKAPMKLQSAGFLTARSLGYPAVRNNEKHDYWDDTSLRLQALGTRAIQFDEAQDAFIRANRPSAENFIQTFKGLMTFEAHPVALILTGTRALEPYFKIVDQQGPRRFYHVTPPGLHPDTDLTYVNKRIDEYCTMAGLENRLQEDDYRRLMYSVSYAFGRTFARAIDAIEEALLANSDGLERLHLAHAYERESTDNYSDVNVFVAEDYQRIDPKTRGFISASEPEKRKGRRRSETKY